MTLFIVLLATVNIGIGFALAVYLGYGQVPWRTNTPTLRQPAASSSVEKPASVDQSLIENNVEPAALADIFDEQADEAIELPAEKAIGTAIAAEAGDTAKPTAELVSELSAAIETKATEAKEDPPELARAEEVEATNETTVAESNAAETNIQEVETPAVAADTEEVKQEPVAEGAGAIESVREEMATSEEKTSEPQEADEKSLAGDAALQNQLEQDEAEPSETEEPESAQGQAVSAEQPVADVAEATDDVVETASDVQEETSISDEVLAGIESFRAQLANIQQKPSEEPESAASHSTEQPVVN